jgi:aspartokinase-like uncharacterized kinase
MTVIFKLGGSLMTLPGLAEKLQFVLRERPNDPCLIIAGGGDSADIVRRWSQVHELSEEVAHWLALSSLDLNRRLIEELLRCRPVISRHNAEAIWASKRSPLLLNLREFVAAEESLENEKLPHNWDVTSDTLSAWTAVRWPATELVLLKSVPAPLGLSVEEASRHEWVDKHFPLIANQLRRISWCNLRAPIISIEPWLTNVSDFS